MTGDDKALGGQGGKQLCKWRFIVRHRWEHIDMVVHDGRNQNVAGVIEFEFAAPILQADDILVAFHNEELVCASVAGFGQVERDRSDEPARILARVTQQEGNKCRQRAFTKAAGHDQIFAVSRELAKISCEVIAGHAARLKFSQFRIGCRVHLGRRAHDSDVDFLW